jgi:protein-tyrosine phosphatase
MMYKFAAASESEPMIFGGGRPGYSKEKIQEWLDFMQSQDIQRVCCLLPESQLAPFKISLLNTYRQTFEPHRVCWSPIEDFQLSDLETLTQVILPFLAEADRFGEKTVVHCAAGVGRTGYVLSAWLVYGRGFTNRDAIAAVRKTGRNPYEAAIAAALKGKNPLKVVAQLKALLDGCRRL